MLTKRIGNAPSMLPADWGTGYPNVWLGATAVTQEEAQRDLPRLLRIPAVLRWISLEPLLGPIALARIEGVAVLDWVVVGFESGNTARLAHLDHARALLRQCQSLGIPAFVKQLGARPVDGGRALRLHDRKGGDMREWPADLRVREYPCQPA